VPLFAGGFACLVVVGLGAMMATDTLPGHPAAEGGSDCERVLGSFQRTSKWARELAAALEGIQVETTTATAARLGSVREGLEREARLLQSRAIAPALEEPQARGLSTVLLLLELANPDVLEAVTDDWEASAAHINEQFLAARTEARAARDALRQKDPACTPARAAQGGSLRLLGRSSQPRAAAD
jgi:hypothetical protein